MRRLRANAMMGVMRNAPSFAEVVDAADALSMEEREELVTLLRRRLAEERRRQIAADVAAGRKEFEAGAVRPSSADDLMRRARS